MGCLVLVHCICKKIILLLRNKEFRFRQCSFGKKSKSKHCWFYYKLELKYYFKELLFLESDSLPPEKGFITPTLRTTGLVAGDLQTKRGHNQTNYCLENCMEKPGQGLEGDWELAHDIVK